MIYHFCLICFSMQEGSAPADQMDQHNNMKMHHDSYKLKSCADAPLSAQIRYASSLQRHLFWKRSFGRKTEDGVQICQLVATEEIRVVCIWLWIHSIELTVQTRLNKVALLQSPAANVCAVRWGRSSHCGTNDWPAGRSSESGEEPTSGSQQAKDAAWGWTENMWFLSLYNCQHSCAQWGLY